ncbi:hypothetical protein [Marinobacterium jannaschii]|uniref:hypothetical protein n=1 Tax=Marinobacterium jannaschii TaxID=64970 RepID=UPI00048156EA|nr:hypothetical protein [Marinobacterium jannaschii]
MEFAAAKTELADAISKFQRCAGSLRSAVSLECDSIWLDDAVTTSPVFQPATQDAIEKALNILTSCQYADGQDGRATKKLVGCLLVGHKSLDAARSFNAAKAALKQASIQLRAVLAAAGETPAKQYQETISILASLGIDRFCANEAYRELPLLDPAPARISFTGKASRSVQNVTIAQAEKLLDGLTSEQSKLDRAKLANLSPDTVIAVVQQGNVKKPVLKANLQWNAADIGLPGQIHSAVPILCLDTGIAPALRYPRQAKKRNRVADRTLADTPYLPSIRGYLHSDKEGEE